MLDVTKLFEGTPLAEVIKIAESGVFDHPELKLGEKETEKEEMTLLEKAALTFLNRHKGEEGNEPFQLVKSLMWFSISARVGKTLSLGIRDNNGRLVIAEIPPHPLE